MKTRLPLSLRSLAVLLFLASPVLLHAKTLNVPSAAYPTIQSGVDAASDGDTVLVSDGTYTGDGNRDIDFHGKSLTVTSQNGPNKTIIDCGGYKTADDSSNHRGFYIHSNEKTATIGGFTVKNGYEDYISGTPDSGYGGGVCIKANTKNTSGTIILTNCTVSGNNAFNSGGGVYNHNFGSGTITLTNCTVSGNNALLIDGGISNITDVDGTITLANCTISGNTAHFFGGVENGNLGTGTITLTNCTVSGNTSKDGGGVYNSDSRDGASRLINTIVYKNTGGEVTNDADSTWSATANNCDIQGRYSGTGNIDVNPQFANASKGDFHLKPGSPCSGAGTSVGAPATDKDGTPRPNPPSMGAYEPAAAPRPCPAAPLRY